VVISASHNPYQDNGIKIFSPSGRKLEDATERLIEADIRLAGSKDEPVENHSSSPPDSGEALILQQGYLDFLEKEIGAGLSLINLKLVIDCANGAASRLAPELFNRLGAKVIAINNEPDGRNINYNCGSLHIEGLIARVLAEGADVGIAFDGDADRALFVDSKGTFVDGDATMWALAKYLDDKGKLKLRTVVATVMSNLGLELALQSKGLQLVRKDVGDKYVLEELMRSGASLGGEQSGHLIFPGVSLAGDGMITAISLLRAMEESGHLSLTEMTDGFTRYPQILVNVRVSEKVPFEELPAVQSLVAEVKRELGNRGRLLLRYSGTERLARVMIEGEQQDVIENYANRIADAIRSSIGSQA
jgi:phosphoglucosamine mutase